MKDGRKIVMGVKEGNLVREDNKFGTLDFALLREEDEKARD